MTKRLKGCLFPFVFIGMVQFSMADSDRFDITIVSDGRGSWGEAKIVYLGEVHVSPQSFILSVTNVVREVRVGAPKATVAMVPFSCSVNFENDFTTVKMSATLGQTAGDNRALSSAYLLTYLISENVIRPFLGNQITKSVEVDQLSGQVVMKPMSPKTIVTGLSNSTMDSKLKVGPVNPPRFFLLPERGGDRSKDCLVIGWWFFSPTQCEWHIRKIIEGETFPRTTTIMSATPKGEKTSTFVDVALSSVDSKIGDDIGSYNRYEILLAPTKK